MQKNKFTFLILLLFSVFTGKTYSATISEFLTALEKVESNCNVEAFNESENALGCLQIRPIMVQDYNRIYGTNIKHSEVKDRKVSHRIAIGIFKHYSKNIQQPNAKHFAFMWNGGGGAWKRVNNPKQDRKQTNLENYWNKVSKNL